MKMTILGRERYFYKHHSTARIHAFILQECGYIIFMREVCIAMTDRGPRVIRLDLIRSCEISGEIIFDGWEVMPVLPVAGNVSWGCP